MRFHQVAATVVIVAALSAAAIPRWHVQHNGTAIPLTRRSPLANQDGTVDFDALQSHIASINAKILQGFYNHEMNTGRPYPAASAVKRRTVTERDITVALKTDVGSYQPHYFGPLAIGTPPETFTVLFDTGSADLIVPTIDCDATCNGHSRWNPTKSTSAKKLPRRFQTVFGGGIINADQYTDNVTISGLTVDIQTIGAPLSYPPRFQVPTFPPDGVLGMAFPSLSKMQGTPFFSALVDKKQLPKPAFSFGLTRTGGELYVGGWSPKYDEGDFTYTRVTKQIHWQVRLENIMDIYKRIVMNGADVIIDTGSAAILGDPSQVKEMYWWLNGKFYSTVHDLDFYTFPCESFPNLGFTFGGRSFKVSAKTLSLGHVPGDPSQCLSGILGNKILGTPSWIIGSVFLQNVYTTFDMGQGRVGFADLKS